MRFAHGLDLPDAALTQHVAIIGATGSGKTYTAKGLVEKLLELRRRVVILDPTGAWWGLRLKADGKAPGFPITIFGGDHADVPITEHAGDALGKLLAEQPVSAILDMSNMGVGERHRFVQRFAEAVFQFNKTPLHLIIDEADEFAPQSGAPGTERMLGAIDRIVRRGRIKGFRVTLISQRPAVINKNVFTQAATLIAMRLPAPQDRKAVEDWIKGQADVDDGKRVMASLAKLEKGHGWVWAPSHGVLQQAHFPRITTFDSSRTPDDGEQIETPASLGSLDLTEIRDAMSTAIEEARGNDVGELKKKVKQLEQDLAAARKLPAAAVMQPEDIERQIQNAKAEVRDKYHAHILFYAQAIAKVMADLARWSADLCRPIDELRSGDHSDADDGCPKSDPECLGNNGDCHDACESPAAVREAVANAKRRVPEFRFSEGDAPPGHILKSDTRKLPRSASVPSAVNGTARGGGTATSATPTGTAAQRILDALAWWTAFGISNPTRVQTAFMAGYSPKSSGFEKQLSILRGQGLIDFPGQGMAALTTQGRNAAHAPAQKTTPGVLWSRVLGQLGQDSAAARVMVAVRNHERTEISRADLASASDYSERSSGFEKTLSNLRGLDLISFPRSGYVSLSAWLRA